MASCDPQTLLASANAFAALPWGLLEAAKAVLLCKILQTNNPMASCDVQSLLKDAACFACLQPFQMQLVQTQLLCEILHAGGSSTTCLVCQSGPPVLPATCECSLSWDSNPNSATFGSFWFWDNTDQQWIPFIGGP